MAALLRLVVCLALFCVQTEGVAGAANRKLRSVEPTQATTNAMETSGITTTIKTTTSTEWQEEEEPKEHCLLNRPCGWAVYTRFTRNIEYFLTNNCKCEDHKRCVRTEDDISVTAFVYRCRPRPPTTTTTSTTTAEPQKAEAATTGVAADSSSVTSTASSQP